MKTKDGEHHGEYDAHVVGGDDDDDDDNDDAADEHPKQDTCWPGCRLLRGCLLSWTEM